MEAAIEELVDEADELVDEAEVDEERREAAEEDEFRPAESAEEWSLLSVCTAPLRLVVRWVIMAIVRATVGVPAPKEGGEASPEAAAAAAPLEGGLGRRFARGVAAAVKWLAVKYVGYVVRSLIFVNLQLRPRAKTTEARSAFKWPLLAHALNGFLLFFWPTLRRIVSNVLRDGVRETVNEVLARMDHAPIKSLVTLECNLGRRPLVVESATLTSGYGGFDFLDLDLVVSFEGDTFEVVSDVSVAGDEGTPQLTARITGLVFKREQLRVKIGPLSTGLPGFGALQIAFARPPATVALQATVTALESVPFVANFALINRFLETHIVQHLLENKFVWPNAVVVPTKVWAPNLGLAALDEWWDAPALEAHRATIKGHLTVEVLGVDVSAARKSGAPTYVRGRIGATARRGKVVVRDGIAPLPGPGAPPMATLVFPVHTDVDHLLLEVLEDGGESSMAHLKFHRTDALLGSASVAFDHIPPYTPTDVDLALDKPSTVARQIRGVLKSTGSVVGEGVSNVIIRPTRSCFSCVFRRKAGRRTRSSHAAAEARRKAVGAKGHSPTSSPKRFRLSSPKKRVVEAEAAQTPTAEPDPTAKPELSPAKPGPEHHACCPQVAHHEKTRNEMRVRFEWAPKLKASSHHRYRLVIQAGLAAVALFNVRLGIRLEKIPVFHLLFRSFGHALLIVVAIGATMPLTTCGGMWILKALTPDSEPAPERPPPPAPVR